MLSNDAVAFYAKPSIKSIRCLTTLLSQGKSIALAPYQEPIGAIQRWLGSLNITTVIGHQDDTNFDSFSGVKKIPFAAVDVLNAESPVNLENVARACTILKTSGTTGTPKSALILGAAHLHSARAVNEYFAFNEQSSWALGLPFHHVSGLSIVFRALVSKGNIVCFNDAQELATLINSDQITHVSLVPTQLQDLLRRPLKINKLKAIILGGDRIPDVLINECQARRWPLYSTYGMTETASMVYVRNHQTGLGQVLGHAQLVSEQGAIKLKAKSLFSGYLEDGIPQLSLDENGFFLTGDLGSFADNDLRIVGRNHHRIISGGENIQLEEIEEAILQHPQVLDCVALGIPCARFGEVVAVFIRYEKNMNLNNSLEAFLRLSLPAFKVPKRFLPWPSEPLSKGKSRRQCLKKIYDAQYNNPFNKF